MFTGSPIFVQFRSYGQRFVGGRANIAWPLAMGPGLLLTLMALAILFWPELLAYMVATAMLFAGVFLLIWGWSLRRAGEKIRNNGTIYYREQ